MENIVEFLILFNMCFLFTVFSFILGDQVWKTIFRFLSMVNWNVLGLFYTGLTSPLVPAIGYFFYVIGVAFFLVLLYDVFAYTQKRKWGEPL